MDQRTCARPDCGDTAVATLVYDYAARSVWVDPVGDEPVPGAWGICAGHADGLRVPNGWTLADRRPPRLLRTPTYLAS